MRRVLQHSARPRRPSPGESRGTLLGRVGGSARSPLPGRAKRCSGSSLLEMVVVMALIGLLAAVAAPAIGHWASNRRLRSAAGEVASAFAYARSEATRTGNVHLVVFQGDAQGNPLAGFPILVVDDGRPGSLDQNCAIDSGEPTQGFRLESGIRFGLTNASSKVSSDSGGSSIVSGSTFLDASGSAATWVLFRPEGPPRAFSSDCTTGNVGSGGGGVYLTNGERDAAVVVTPLGAVRIHAWNPSASGWSS